jgi:hypothetical protein
LRHAASQGDEIEPYLQERQDLINKIFRNSANNRIEVILFTANKGTGPMRGAGNEKLLMTALFIGIIAIFIGGFITGIF